MITKKRLLRIGWFIAILLVGIGAYQSLPVYRSINGTNGSGTEVSLVVSYFLFAGVGLMLALLFLNRDPFKK